MDRERGRKLENYPPALRDAEYALHSALQYG